MFISAIGLLSINICSSLPHTKLRNCLLNVYFHLWCSYLTWISCLPTALKNNNLDKVGETPAIKIIVTTSKAVNVESQITSLEI